MNLCRNAVRAIAIGVLLTVVALPAMGAEQLDPEVDKILKAMSSYLTTAKAFSLNADVALEVVLKNGQKVQLCSSQVLLLRRPSEFRIQVKGKVADAEFTFDGKTLTLFGRKRNAYVQRQVTGTIDDAIHKWEYETGISATGADLLLTGVYSILSSGVESSTYFGTAWINGIEVHHLALRKDDVDLQLWVQTGDRPLPIKYVITTKWLTGEPQFELVLRDWNMSPQIKDNQFTFVVPKGAKKLESVPIEEMDEFPRTKEGQ
jgi:hypothetical protein